MSGLGRARWEHLEVQEHLGSCGGGFWHRIFRISLRQFECGEPKIDPKIVKIKKSNIETRVSQWAKRSLKLTVEGLKNCLNPLYLNCDILWWVMGFLRIFLQFPLTQRHQKGDAYRMSGCLKLGFTAGVFATLVPLLHSYGSYGPWIRFPHDGSTVTSEAIGGNAPVASPSSLAPQHRERPLTVKDQQLKQVETGTFKVILKKS